MYSVSFYKAAERFAETVLSSCCNLFFSEEAVSRLSMARFTS
jgi:hypothetical protein